MRKKILFALKGIAVIIMLQTLFFKFSAANQSVELFTKIAGEHEAYLRIGTGIIELIASILLFTSKNSWLGAFMTLGVMSGAILGHITILGISHNNDGGLLFGAAVYIFIVALVVLINQRKKIFILGKHF
ncbi:DoxX family protein [Polaribacter marinivivus]|uniref:DoxX family protein n=1 Tax=Polaribacter marinivivus TaxID=1524260 RepID=A0ABV8RAC7_9FLAO